jgi:hypothetical protein
MTDESRLISALAFGPGNFNGSIHFSFMSSDNWGYKDKKRAAKLRTNPTSPIQ